MFAIVTRQLYLPARFGDSGNFPRQRQRSETEATELEFPEISARPAATETAIMRPPRKFGRPPGFGSHTGSCHSNSRPQFRQQAGFSFLLLTLLGKGHSQHF